MNSETAELDESGSPKANPFYEPLTDKIREVLNCHCAENDSNTPDFVLAQYLMKCLEAFNIAVQQREGWYGRDPRPSVKHPTGP